LTGEKNPSFKSKAALPEIIWNTVSPTAHMSLGSPISDGDAESPLSCLEPIADLEFVLDRDMDGFVTKLGANSSLLNQPMSFDQPMPHKLEDGPTRPMMAFFGSGSVLRNRAEVGFDAPIVDSFDRSVEHFAAAGSLMDIFMRLLDNVPGIRVDLLDRAQSPGDYAALLEMLLTRGSPVALRDGEDTVVLPTLAFLSHIRAISALIGFQLPIPSDPRTIRRSGSARWGGGRRSAGAPQRGSRNGGVAWDTPPAAEGVTAEKGREGGGRGWENHLESKRRKVGVSMEKCCSNRLE
jgi:hypothetical protein